MAAQNFTPPYPFEHRNSPEDLLAYNEAVENDNVRDLLRRWAEEDEQDEALLKRQHQEDAEKEATKSKMEKLLEATESIKNASSLNSKTWMTKSEAAKYLGVSERTIDRKRETGSLRASLVEGTSTFRFKKTDLDELMS
ncbi:helix-turn-helix domain-containing protein [Cerasicoccus frondis]|uniref:helix-turn-helix domain-containing protein n=1 Tax=Cerasicoccus frondis TaxID=490090 RepID=UPI00285256E5|nr:helix-turn-helix domain-containing protein [Cerasicoccus frondis]